MTVFLDIQRARIAQNAAARIRITQFRYLSAPANIDITDANVPQVRKRGWGACGGELSPQLRTSSFSPNMCASSRAPRAPLLSCTRVQGSAPCASANPETDHRTQLCPSHSLRALHRQGAACRLQQLEVNCQRRTDGAEEAVPVVGTHAS